MSSVTYQNKKDGRTQTFDEREKVRAQTLERSGWFLVQDEPVESEGKEVVGTVEESNIDDFTQLAGVSHELNDALHAAGFYSYADLVNADVDKLIAVKGVGKATAAKLQQAAAETP